tara:strand:+ start:2355 stop:3740 length:1386 start_codon:yes stop_codon:yes gene_type:complete
MIEEPPEQYSWAAQPGPQRTAVWMGSAVDELFYGGAVFGGKSDFLLGDFAQDLDQGSKWKGVLFRLSYPDLEEIIDRSHEIYPHCGGEYLVGKYTWKFPGGAVLRLRHLEREQDYTKYMGWSLSWIGWDELPSWETLTPYRMMTSRLRGAAMNKRIRATGNPGGRCHNEIKEYFGIGDYPQGMVPLQDSDSGMVRMFVPSKLTDNKLGLGRDPGYEQRLENLGDPELIKAWKDGDWDAVIGNYFSMFSRKDAVVDGFEIPSTWSVFSCMDYGESNPTWAGLIAVDYDDSVWVIDEYYRAGAGGADHARAIAAMIDNCPYLRHRPRLHLAPPDMWTRRAPGEASQAKAPKDSFEAEGIHLTRANADRITGWRNLKDLMYSGRIKFFRHRTDRVVESLATVQRCSRNAEDVEKGGDDHPADGLRYGINHVYRPRRADVRPSGDGQTLIDRLLSNDDNQYRYAG